MRAKRITAGVCFTICCGGCGSTPVNLVDGPHKENIYNGVVYYLPKLQHDVLVSRELTACKGKTLAVSITAKVTPRLVPDLAHGYVFALDDLPSTGTLGVQLHENGMLRSVNVEVQDDVGRVLSAVASTAVSLVSVSAKMLGTDTESDVCNAATMHTLAQLTEKREALPKARTDLQAEKTASSEVKTYQEKVSAERAVAMSESRVSALEKEIAALRKKLTHEQAYSTNSAGEQLAPSKSLCQRWFECKNGDSAWEELVPKATVHALLLADGSATDSSPPPASGDIVYRKPVPGRFVLCPGEPCAVGNDRSLTGVPLFTTPALIPQMGRYVRLPLNRKILADVAVQAAFAENGDLQSFKYVSKTSLEATSKSLNESVKAVAPLLESIRNRDRTTAEAEAAKAKAEADKVLAELAREKAQRELDALRGQP